MPAVFSRLALVAATAVLVSLGLPGAPADGASGVEVVPAILMRGGASDESGEHRTGGVQIGAVGGDWLPVAPELRVNGSLVAPVDSKVLTDSGGGTNDSPAAAIAIN